MIKAQHQFQVIQNNKYWFWDASVFNINSEIIQLSLFNETSTIKKNAVQTWDCFNFCSYSTTRFVRLTCKTANMTEKNLFIFIVIMDCCDAVCLRLALLQIDKWFRINTCWRFINPIRTNRFTLQHADFFIATDYESKCFDANYMLMDFPEVARFNLNTQIRLFRFHNSIRFK